MLARSAAALQHAMSYIYQLDETSIERRYTLVLQSDDDGYKLVAEQAVLTAFEGLAFDRQRPSLLIGDTIEDWLLKHAFALSKKRLEPGAVTVDESDQRCGDVIVIREVGTA